jgi:hypothetical protein
MERYEKDSSEYYKDWKKGKISSIGACTGNYRFQTTATDRWFVPEGKGYDLEDKLRK